MTKCFFITLLVTILQIENNKVSAQEKYMLSDLLFHRFSFATHTFNYTSFELNYTIHFADENKNKIFLFKDKSEEKAKIYIATYIGFEINPFIKLYAIRPTLWYRLPNMHFHFLNYKDIPIAFDLSFPVYFNGTNEFTYHIRPSIGYSIDLDNKKVNANYSQKRHRHQLYIAYSYIFINYENIQIPRPTHQISIMLKKIRISSPFIKTFKARDPFTNY